MNLTATYKVSARLLWPDKGMLLASVITLLGPAIGMPVLMRNVQADGADVRGGARAHPVGGPRS